MVSPYYVFNKRVAKLQYHNIFTLCHDTSIDSDFTLVTTKATVETI